MGQGIQEWSKQTETARLSFTNFTWSILEYLDPYDVIANVLTNIENTSNTPRINLEITILCKMKNVIFFLNWKLTYYLLENPLRFVQSTKQKS